MDYGIKGRGALVTGADSGIGFATARQLLAEGTRLVITDTDAAKLQEAAAKLGNVTAVPADLTDPAAVAALRDQALAALGKVEILVNCAGITGPTGAFHDLTDDDWQKTLDTNLMSAVRVVRAFLPAMRANGWGRIVLTGSEDAVQPYVDELPYCASKAAILNLTKGLSKAYAADGILVNAVSPAFIATPMTDAMMHKRAKEKGTSFEEAIQSFLREERPTLDLRRRGEADEVAAAILFLCSAGASFVTGATLRVDGGSVATMGF